jgi:peroxiredoxin/outer membrane lipoprotein-sorting protein
VRRLLSLLCVFAAGVLAEPQAPQPAPFSVVQKLQAISKKYGAAKRYEFTGDMVIDGLEPNARVATPIGEAKVEVAFGEDGRYLFKIHPKRAAEYVTVCDGQKTWTFVPSKKQYMVEESASDDADASVEQPDSADDNMVEQYARAVVSTLKNLYSSARTAGFYGYDSLKINGEKGKWPVIRVESKNALAGNGVSAELVFDPDTLAIGRMVIANVQTNGGQRVTVRSWLQFDHFTVGDVPDDRFTFDAPKNAKLVEELQIPGQTGVALVGHMAPDFELKTLDGEKVKLSDLRGKPVMLNFWATWCPPCRHELPTVAKLNSEYASKGLMVFGVNDEGKTKAKGYLYKAQLQLPTLDDSDGRAHKLYGIRAIPMVFIIDKDGKIAHYFRGGREEPELRAALKSVGM